MSTELIEQEESGQAALVAINTGRASQEVQAAMIIAKRFPRDETQALVKIRNACKRQRLAESAVYTYARGGAKIEGPSIRLAECMAQCWGNLDYGVVELEQRNGESTCMAYCWDMETNTKQTKVFQVKHVRQTKRERKLLTDPRDIYENVANNGARRLRACILGVIPGDIVDEALEEVEKTLKKAGGDKPIKDRIRAMAMKFDELGVSQEMLEKRLQHKVDATTEAELVDLRKIFNSMKDGMSTRDDWFPIEPRGKKATAVDIAELTGEPTDGKLFETEEGYHEEGM